MESVTSEEIIWTLFGVSTTKDKPSDRKDVFFGPRFQLQLGFMPEGEEEPEHLYLIDLDLPFGRVNANQEDWSRLVSRFEEQVSEKEGKPHRYIPQSKVRSLLKNAQAKAFLEAAVASGMKFHEA